jgi:hypothetical protein
VAIHLQVGSVPFQPRHFVLVNHRHLVVWRPLSILLPSWFPLQYT